MYVAAKIASCAIDSSVKSFSVLTTKHPVETQVKQYHVNFVIIS